jgi:hypothetical protein
MGRILFIAVLALLGGTAGNAAAQNTAIVLRAGTFGPSGGVTTSLGRVLNVRLDVPYLTYSRSAERRIDDFDLRIDATMRLSMVSAIVDLHPFGNGVRLSAGALYNRSEATFTGRSAGPYTVGSTTYTAEEIGELSGVLRMGEGLKPYAGIGFGNAVSTGKRLGFLMDIGVMFSGPPQFTMTGSGMVAPTAEEAAQIQQNLDWARFYPGVSLGISYRIF